MSLLSDIALRDLVSALRGAVSPISRHDITFARDRVVSAAITVVGEQLAKDVIGNQPLDLAVRRATGITDARLSAGIRNAFRTATGAKVSGASVAAHLAEFLLAFRDILNPGNIHNIPTAECLAKHLPDDRPPTDIELEEAWRACEKEHA